jgi:hypothetical protein
MEEQIQLLIDAIRKAGSRFDTVEYAMFRQRRCEKRNDKDGAVLWQKVATLAAVCCS